MPNSRKVIVTALPAGDAAHPARLYGGIGELAAGQERRFLAREGEQVRLGEAP